MTFNLFAILITVSLSVQIASATDLDAIVTNSVSESNHIYDEYRRQLDQTEEVEMESRTKPQPYDPNEDYSMFAPTRTISNADEM